MTSGMFVSMIMAQNWEDASMHATTMKRAKINAWINSKLGNLTALVRYDAFTIRLYSFWYLYIFQENCPGGCPCDDYPCAETTTASDLTTPTAPATTTSPATNAVLVLSTSKSANKPLVIDWDGKFIENNISLSEFKTLKSGNYNDDLNFEYGDGTTVYCGCGSTLMGQFWYFGGYPSTSNKRQVNN